MMQMEKKAKVEYVSKAGLKAIGWTDRAISVFLDPCDKEAKNPHYAKAAPMRLYLKSRVEETEKSEAYQKFLGENAGRVASARKAVDTKKEKLLKELSGWTIVLKAKPYQKVIAAAIRSYNEFHEEMLYERGHDYTPAKADSDPEFLQRITVNYLRHELSDYDDRLEALFGKVGKDDAYRILNKMIYDKIADTYSELRDECNRQMMRKNSGE